MGDFQRVWLQQRLIARTLRFAYGPISGAQTQRNRVISFGCKRFPQWGQSAKNENTDNCSKKHLATMQQGFQQ